MNSRTYPVLILLAALALDGCGGSGEEKGADPKIRLLNLSSGYSSLDLMTNLDSDDKDDDETQALRDRVAQLEELVHRAGLDDQGESRALDQDGHR